MKWLEAAVAASRDGAQFVEAVLVNENITGWRTEDEAEMRAFLLGDPRGWDYVDEKIYSNQRDVIIKFYVTDNEDGRATLRAVTDGLDGLRSSAPGFCLGPLSVATTPADDEDWADNWKKYFKPFTVGKNIAVYPAWELYDGPGSKTAVGVNPGHMFGTGQHETTRMCMEAIEAYAEPGLNVLDLGCGSGILSVTALLLGASDCTAVDFDPGAADVVAENAKLNKIPAGRIKILIGDIINDPGLKRRIGAKKYGLVVANITADAIISVSRIISGGWLAPGGVFISSGIITERSREVQEALSGDGFTIAGIYSDGEWVCIVCRNFS